EARRVDIEHGAGTPPPPGGTTDAGPAGAALAAAQEAGVLPPFCGVRFKSMEAPTRQRGLRSLYIFLGALLDAGELPVGWVQTLPKVTSARQVEAMVVACSRLEEV